MTSNNGAFRFVDLFAGLGGFHLALKALGGVGVFAAELDSDLRLLYEKNHGLYPWGDINTLLNPAQDVPDHEVLTAGFPCQPFSKAGEQQGFEDTHQGQLFFRVLDILAAKRPGYFILENVPHILRHRNEQTKQEIVSRLSDLGYAVKIQRLSPHQFGIPQIRDRAYFVGSLDGLDAFEWPQPRPQNTDIRHILDQDELPHRKVPETTLRAIDVWDDFLKSSPSDVKLPSFPIWSMEFGATYPYEDVTPFNILCTKGTHGLSRFSGSFGDALTGMSREEILAALPSHARREDWIFPKWKVDFIRQNREFYIENKYWIDPWLERSRLWELPSSLQKLEWNAQGERRTINEYILQVRASGLRVKRTNTAPSLIAMTHTQVPIVAWERRYMTPTECARLQNLDDIHLPSNDLNAYKALGNAVNAKVVQEIATPLLARLAAR